MTGDKNRLSSELQALLSDLLDGTLSDQGQQKLCEILRGNPDAQDEYRSFMALHALLHLDFSNGQIQRLPPVVQSLRAAQSRRDASAWLDETSDGSSELEREDLLTRQNSKHIGRWPSAKFEDRKWRLASAMATLAASVLFIAWWFSLPRAHFDRSDAASIATSDAEQQPEQLAKEEVAPSESRAVAVLGQASRATWSDPSLPLNSGASLQAGEFKLDQGFVQIEFVSGATVVIEGPAQFNLISPSRISCKLGKIRAHVPNQAIGFTIETPTYSAVDLGTEFTVQVKPTGESQFQVLDGEVNLLGSLPDRPAPVQRLTAGQGARSTADGKLTETTVGEGNFVGGEKMLEIASASLRERYEKWKHFSRDIRLAPNVILYYGFDGHEPWERVLRHEGSEQNDMLNGAIVGCQWTGGRWNGKQALEFKRTGDRVRLTVPGEFESLTYAAWLRVEGLERWLSSLLLTDGQQPGEVHWQMTDQGQLMLGVKAEPDKSHDFYSPSVIGPKDLGRWVHVACVYNGKDGYVSHVVDGVEVSREAVRIPTKLRIGEAEIGNWVPEDLLDNRVRSLNGRVDEFILFNSPFTTEQIRSIYEAGRPQS